MEKADLSSAKQHDRLWRVAWRNNTSDSFNNLRKSFTIHVVQGYCFAIYILFCFVTFFHNLTNQWVPSYIWIHFLKIKRKSYCSPVVVPEFDVSPGLQNLPVLQPGELGLRLALSLAGEDRVGADGPRDGLRSLNKLSWSWKRRETASQIRWPRFTNKWTRREINQCQRGKQED